MGHACTQQSQHEMPLHPVANTYPWIFLGIMCKLIGVLNSMWHVVCVVVYIWRQLFMLLWSWRKWEGHLQACFGDFSQEYPPPASIYWTKVHYRIDKVRGSVLVGLCRPGSTRTWKSPRAIETDAGWGIWWIKPCSSNFSRHLSHLSCDTIWCTVLLGIWLQPLLGSWWCC